MREKGDCDVLACQAEAKSPDIGLNTFRFTGSGEGLVGFDGEKGGVTTCEHIGHRSLLTSARVELLGR